MVVLSGAGISAESGVATFRGAGGLWEGHRIEDVASPEGWEKDPELVLDFYNKRRQQMMEVKPNRGHVILAELEEHFDVQVITQNIDDLHEQAGSSNVLHLHGEIKKVRSTGEAEEIFELGGWQLNLGDMCPRGHQLRPHIVWFGESVPMIEPAMHLCAEADLFLVIGTSLVVYPASGLIHYVQGGAPKFVVDPNQPAVSGVQNLRFLSEPATTGMEKLKIILLEEGLNC